MSGALQGSILGPVLCNLFINVFSEGPDTSSASLLMTSICEEQPIIQSAEASEGLPWIEELSEMQVLCPVPAESNKQNLASGASLTSKLRELGVFSFKKR